MTKQEYKEEMIRLGNIWAAQVSQLLQGETIQKVEYVPVTSGVDDTDVIQGYAQLSLGNGTHVRLGIDYEECEFLVYQVDEAGNPISKIITDSECIPE